MAILTNASIIFNTHGDNKDGNTNVYVFLKNRLNNSLTPEQNSDFISNWLAMQRYQPGGDIGERDRNPYLAYGLFWNDDEFEDPSSREFPLTLVSSQISRDDIILPQVDIHILADGSDTWIFDYTVTLTFDDQTNFSFTSASDGVQGIIFDQDHRNYSGIGVENPLRILPLPVLTKPDTAATLTKVTLQFSEVPEIMPSTLDVHIANRLSSTSAQDIVIGVDILKTHPAKADGKTFIWSRGDGTLVSNNIRLADMVLPVFYIRTASKPGGPSLTWSFDYQVTLEFENPQDFGNKTQIYSSRINGVVLDQDRKHMGVIRAGRSRP